MNRKMAVTHEKRAQHVIHNGGILDILANVYHNRCRQPCDHIQAGYSQSPSPCKFCTVHHLCLYRHQLQYRLQEINTRKRSPSERISRSSSVITKQVASTPCILKAYTDRYINYRTEHICLSSVQVYANSQCCKNE
jgi:hypothetical protein